MHELTFYRQERNDGGIRMGVERDGDTTLLDDFREGPPERQDQPLGSALLWYFDLRCHGEDLPSEPDGAREWFLRHEEAFRDGLLRLASEIVLGTDDSTPIRWDRFKDLPAVVRVEAVLSATRRVTNERLIALVIEIAENIGEFLAQLSPLPSGVL